MFVSLQDVLLLVALAVACYFGAKFLFQKDTEREDRKEKAQELALLFKEHGFEHLPKILGCYSRDDWSGIAHEIKLLYEITKRDPEAILAELDKVHEKYAAARAKDKEA